MDFRILGPVELETREGRVDLGPLKQRTVLAALLVDAGRLVTHELLIDRVWDGCPPAEVRNTLYTYVARLRRVLASVPGAERARLLRRSGGYLLDVDPEMVDAHRFTGLAAQARAPGLTEERRCELASRALAEFGAVPLTDLTCQWAARVREHLGRRRRDMLTLHATLEIRFGRAASVVDGLYAALVEQPLAEDLVGALMSALYFSGRSAEAVGLFAHTRAVIAAELGVEPGPELCRRHEEILRGEHARPALGAVAERTPCLTQPDAAESAGQHRPAVPAPSTLPPPVPSRTGRAAKSAGAIRAPGRAADSECAQAAVLALVGAGELEKSMLAIHVAHQVRAAYLNGQLSADRTAARTDAASVLSPFLRPLGTVLELLPEPAGELAERCRSLLAGSRILVVLESAENEALVAALLPAQGAPA